MIKIDMEMPRACSECKLEHLNFNTFMCIPANLVVEDYRSTDRHPTCPLHPLDDEIRVGDEVTTDYLAE